MTPQQPQQERTHFVEIINCDDCPYKEYGLRKCEALDRWFDDGDYFEPENEIAPWCPKCSRPHATPATANKALIFIPKPSDELIVLAEKEWTNRAERKGRYEKASWITGWLEGYFSKPVNIVQHDTAIRNEERNATLDEVCNIVKNRELQLKSTYPIGHDQRDGALARAAEDIKILTMIESLRTQTTNHQERKE